MTTEAKKITGYPQVNKIRTFLQIARDFTKPFDAIREAISNAIDAGAKNIYISAWEDLKMPGGELVIEVEDDGEGMNEDSLLKFFNLGDSTRIDEGGQRAKGFIGEKGHGTKTYFNSREIEVFTKVVEGDKFYAIMDNPLMNLLQNKEPMYEYEKNPSMEIKEGTKIIIRGFNNNVKRDFSHRLLKDRIQWFTAFADFSWILEAKKPKKRENSDRYLIWPKLYLCGLGFEGGWDEIGYGQEFPLEFTKMSELKKIDESDPIGWYVKKWIKKGLSVKDFPHVKLDIVFSLEGDLIRRNYNPLIRYVGKTKEHGNYTITERYGLWATKDYIPITRVNDWFMRGRSEWTRFHAFVNCQEFALTANRADINNTDPDLLIKVEETIDEFYQDHVENSKEYQEYVAAVKEQKQYKNVKQETQDFNLRKSRAIKKQVAGYKGITLVAPGPIGRGERGQEMGVHCLFVQIATLNPDAFPFRVVDYDTHRGYDCLLTSQTVLDLNNPDFSFLEFKYSLETQFDHSFEKLRYIVCWECNLNAGTEIYDLSNERRILEIYPIGTDGRDHTEHYLRGLGKGHNIKVFVLKNYLKEKLGIEFKPVATTN